MKRFKKESLIKRAIAKLQKKDLNRLPFQGVECSNVSRFLAYIYTFLGFSVFIFANIYLNVYIGYRAVGFVILLGVLAVGTISSLGPTLFSAVLSALAWNYFFIPPRFTFAVDRPEDIFMCVTYFVVALITGFLTNQIKHQENLVRERELRAEKLRQSEVLHQTLLNSISHELRTPLTVLMGTATMLADPEHAKNSALVQSLGEELVSACDRLNRVIENLLDMSRLNSGLLEPQMEWHDLRDLIGVTLQKLKNQLKHHKVEVRIQENLPMVQMDFRLMEHVLSNLLLNASQYAPLGSTVRISADQERDQIALVVEDEGEGIPAASLDRVFEKFYRVPGSPTGGTGLGLSIAKGLLEAQRGHISVSSGGRHGAKFTVELPLRTLTDLPKEIS